ncbi:hypothetical protein MNAN1_000646 [Malassezia nana]|uniref:Major facilitator superfamily (MFS) profile domain-containing protein n=1 Tax=Malassezia nana TaxID=180528 RepID=A0AAF0EP79_9BASI|nr:hypothetical protein MNAN1_000646 [Malassezia nana]
MSDRWIGLLMSSLFSGMMLGAVVWGRCADIRGRLYAYHRTLLVAAVGGAALSAAPSWVAACLCAVVLGAGIGGSMPIDGTLFVESLPPERHYWLTALSVFFSVGSVVSAMIAMVLLVGLGTGFRTFLFALAVLTAVAAAARLGRFRTLESPAFLFACGREDEANLVLQAMDRDLESMDSHPSTEESQGALFSAGQARTTVVLWSLWTLQSLAYTMFNALYPLYLERKKGSMDASEAAVLRDVLAYSLSSVPGSLIGAFLVRSSWSRYALPLTLSSTALALVLFLWATQSMLIVAAGMMVSLSATTAYAVLMCCG